MPDVKGIPEGYRSLTPSLAIRGAAEAIDWYKKVLGAKEIMRMPMPNGKIGHAELEFGDSKLMLADEAEEWGNLSPAKLGGSAVTLYYYVDDVDGVTNRARAAGARIRMEPADQFYGDRVGSFDDPFGHIWTVAKHVEDVTDEQMDERMKAMTTA
jgi:PhnB protein